MILKDKKWITAGLKISIRHKDKLFKLSTLKPRLETICCYSKYRNILTTCLRKVEESYFHEFINSERQNLYTLWKIFGSVINPKKIKSNNCIPKLIINYNSSSNDSDIANVFNEHFSTIGEKLANKFDTNKAHFKYLKNSNMYSFFLNPTDKN